MSFQNSEKPHRGKKEQGGAENEQQAGRLSLTGLPGSHRRADQ